ncbi:MAG TPA: hypothetical protein VLJ57_10960 [Burkholderiaceae bacterium]|nr:hypothetical protein [Burkholderiaceae bacterium]
MGPIDLLIHLLNFVAPAFCLAVLTMLAARFFMPRDAATPVWWVQVATSFVACVAMSLAGLWYFGRDGKMATYAALVAVCAVSQWLVLRGWRK